MEFESMTSGATSRRSNLAELKAQLSLLDSNQHIQNQSL